MTSRPAPGIQESLQRAGSGAPPRPQVRRQAPTHASVANTQRNHDVIDLTLDGERKHAEDTLLKSRTAQTPAKPKLGSLEHIQTAQDAASRPPPRGKPQLAFNPRANDGGETPGFPPQSGHGTTSSSGATNMPIPPRPGSSAPDDLSQPHRRILPGGTGVKHDRNAKFAGFEPPAAAVVFPNGRTADFYPWSPQSPEDILTDALVKGGVNNKPSMINETNTARPSLWSNLKNKSGLQTLSTLLCAVLEKRQQCGRLTAPSTFKPPPRVTLTDSKRETWLRDLANPAIALRRLSRTIPHGIRGKLLLEQCLSKNIPIARAVWLAKCIGSNELRAFKRKGATGTVGMGAELKWNREWTIFVEQFVENTVSSCGQPDWKARMDYATRLSSHLYSDRLLDQDHYLDWLLGSVDGSTPERLPVWLLMTQIYWQDLIASRRRGRRLAEALLSHAHALRSDPSDDTNRTLSGHLDKLIATLLFYKPCCLLLPKIWDNRREVINDLVLKYPNSPLDRIAQDLDSRNKRLSGISENSQSTPTSLVTRIVTLLDSSEKDISVNIDRISTACLDNASDPQQVVATVLHWASSLYRTGTHRIYLATRLIRKWNISRIDTDAAIHAFLFSLKADHPFETRNVFRIIAELVRSRHFSVGRYLQWLIATGSTNGNQGSPDDWPSHLRLIAEIPLDNLLDPVLNLRNTLLHGIGFTVETEEDQLNAGEDYVASQIPGLFESWSPSEAPEEMDVSELTCSIRLSLGCLLRQQVASKVQSTDQAASKTTLNDGTINISTLTAADVYSIRELVEKLGDFSILADILGMVVNSCELSILAAVADTLHYHYKTFVAIGAFKSLFQRLASRYALLRTERPPERELFLSLADLSRTAKADPQMLHLLRYDLGRCEPKNSLAACSPASDNMTDILQTTKMDTDDEINHILSSGTNMDEQIIARVFMKITSQLEEHVKKDQTRSNTFATWFYRLRSFDEKTFERLMNEYLMNLLTTHQGRILLATLPTLIAAGCTTLVGFAELSKLCIMSVNPVEGNSAAKMSLVALNALLPNEELNWFCQIPDAYRYRLCQQKFCADRPEEMLEHICRTIESCSSHVSTDLQAHFTSLLSSDRLLGVLRQLAVHEFHAFAVAFQFRSDAGSDHATSAVKTLLNSLLDPENSLDLAPKPLDVQVSTIVQIADDFSLPFCQLQLRQIFEMSKTSTAESSEDTVSTALLDAIKIAVDNDRSNWSDLIKGLDGSLTRKIREHAENAILATIGNPGREGSSPTSTTSVDETFIRRYLTVVDFTSSNIATEGQSSMMVVLVEKLKAIMEHLNSTTGKILDEHNRDVGYPSFAPSVADIRPSIDAVLHLAVLHKSSFQSGKSSNQTQATFLWLLRTLFGHPSLQRHLSITEYLFDIGAYFSDDLADDVRAVLAKADLAKPSPDPRSSYIFGTSPPPDCWLGLITQSAGATNAMGGTSQTSMQSQHSHQNQQSQPQSPMPIHRSLSQQNLQKTGSPLQQQNKGMPSLQRFATQHPLSTQQLQIQQFQQLAQARSASASPQQNPSQAMFIGHGTAPGMTPGGNNPGNFWNQANPQGGRSTPPLQQPQQQPQQQQQDKAEVRPMPFVLRRWEILPDPASIAGGNDTALSLGLFEARKV